MNYTIKNWRTSPRTPYHLENPYFVLMLRELQPITTNIKSPSRPPRAILRSRLRIPLIIEESIRQIKHSPTQKREQIHKPPTNESPEWCNIRAGNTNATREEQDRTVQEPESTTDDNNEHIIPIARVSPNLRIQPNIYATPHDPTLNFPWPIFQPQYPMFHPWTLEDIDLPRTWQQQNSLYYPH
jgi:hypothetical protein